jgi:hypothetical protein
MDNVETYDQLILNSRETVAGGDTESDTFMRGFAYGRFSTLDSELARHWGLSRDCPLDRCSKIPDVPANLLAAMPDSGRIEKLEERIAAVRQVIEQGYSGVGKTDKCQHDKFGFEECIACYDEALLAALEPSR